MNLTYQRSNWSCMTFTIDGKSVELNIDQLNKLHNKIDEMWSECSYGGNQHNALTRWLDYSEAKAIKELERQENAHAATVQSNQQVAAFRYRIKEDLFVGNNYMQSSKVIKAYQKAFPQSSMQFENSRDYEVLAHTTSRAEAIELKLFLFSFYFEKAVNDLATSANEKPTVIKKK